MKVFKIKWQGVSKTGKIHTVLIKAKNKEMALIKLGQANKHNDITKLISIKIQVSKTESQGLAKDL